MEHRCKEREDRGKRGVVDGGHKPAYIIRVGGSKRDLRIVDDAVYLFVTGAELCKRQGADDTDHTNDAHDENRIEQVPARETEDLTALDEYAGADHDADDHGDCGGQSEPFLHLLFDKATLPSRSVFKTDIIYNVIL